MVLGGGSVGTASGVVACVVDGRVGLQAEADTKMRVVTDGAVVRVVARVMFRAEQACLDVAASASAGDRSPQQSRMPACVRFVTFKAKFFPHGNVTDFF